MAPWTDIADRKLLLTLIDPKAKKDWDHSAKLMGPGYSAEACRQHFRKLKEEIEGMNSASATTTNDPTTNKTAPASAMSRKRKAEPTAAAPAKKRGRRAAPATSVASAAIKDEENESE